VGRIPTTDEIIAEAKKFRIQLHADTAIVFHDYHVDHQKQQLVLSFRYTRPVYNAALVRQGEPLERSLTGSLPRIECIIRQHDDPRWFVLIHPALHEP